MTDREEIDALRAEINTINREAAARHDEYAYALAEGRLERDKLRAELEAAKADRERLDKVARMKIDTDIALCGPSEWVAFDPFGEIFARGANIRECIDGVPE